MSTDILTNFNMKSGQPLDSRLVVADIISLYSINPVVRYNGMTVYVESEKTQYILKVGNSSDDKGDNNNWHKLLDYTNKVYSLNSSSINYDKAKLNSYKEVQHIEGRITNNKLEILKRKTNPAEVPDDAIMIFDLAGFKNFAENPENWDKNWQLMADIDYLGQTLPNPIGYLEEDEDENKVFSGGFYGNGYTIRNMVIDTSSSKYCRGTSSSYEYTYVGIFGLVRSVNNIPAVITNTTFDNISLSFENHTTVYPNVSYNHSYRVGIVARFTHDGSINEDNKNATGVLSDITIKNSSVDVNVSATAGYSSRYHYYSGAMLCASTRSVNISNILISNCNTTLTAKDKACMRGGMFVADHYTNFNTTPTEINNIRLFNNTFNYDTLGGYTNFRYKPIAYVLGHLDGVTASDILIDGLNFNIEQADHNNACATLIGSGNEGSGFHFQVTDFVARNINIIGTVYNGCLFTHTQVKSTFTRCVLENLFADVAIRQVDPIDKGILFNCIRNNVTHTFNDCKFIGEVNISPQLASDMAIFSTDHSDSVWNNTLVAVKSLSSVPYKIFYRANTSNATITVNNSFYDSDLRGSSDGTTIITPKTTAELKDMSTYSAWSDTAWDIDNNIAGEYPSIQNEYANHDVTDVFTFSNDVYVWDSGVSPLFNPDSIITNTSTSFVDDIIEFKKTIDIDDVLINNSSNLKISSSMRKLEDLEFNSYNKTINSYNMVVLNLIRDLSSFKMVDELELLLYNNTIKSYNMTVLNIKRDLLSFNME
jgi:hypothetical protein